MARFLRADTAEPSEPVFFAAAPKDARLDLGDHAAAVVRVSERAARDEADIVVDRADATLRAMTFKGGARLVVSGGHGAEATIALAGGARLHIGFPDPSALAGASGVDLRL
jgi:hypothetical protein